MKKILCCILLLGSCSFIYSQSLKKYSIGGTGCSVNSYCEPKFGITYSEDSAKVYTSECGNNDIYYMVICIELKQTLIPVSKAESALITYVNHLKTQFKIISSTGYSTGHKLNGSENTRGIIEYWKDNEQFNWKIKGWTDGRFIAVLLVYSKKNLPETTVNPFLDGLFFKGI